MRSITETLTHDQLMQLATLKREPQTLVEFQARQWLRVQNLEAERVAKARQEEFEREQREQERQRQLHTKTIAQSAVSRQPTARERSLMTGIFKAIVPY